MISANLLKIGKTTVQMIKKINNQRKLWNLTQLVSMMNKILKMKTAIKMIIKWRMIQMMIVNKMKDWRKIKRK